MAFKLGDIFIGEFQMTQRFAENRDIYNARYGLLGHNGIDFGCPSMTPVLAAADGWIKEAAFDVAGYGKYIKVIHNGYLTLYAHLNDFNVNVGDRVVAGQLIGHSNNTGFSTAPHLHFGVAPCDANGLKTEPQNGFSGYIDPLGIKCVWEIKGLKTPVFQQSVVKPPVQVPADTFIDLRTKSTNWDVVCAYFKLTELESIDPKMGEKLVVKIADQITNLEQQIANLQKETPPPPTIPEGGIPFVTVPEVEVPFVTVPKEQAEELAKTPMMERDIKDLFKNLFNVILFKK